MTSTDKAKARRGRPANEALQGTIVGAAGNLFLEHGFQSTTMDKVAKCAGISKLSIYRHFPSKEALFSAAIARKCQEFAPDTLFIGTQGTPADRLLAAGEGMLWLLMSDEARGVEAMIVADAANRNQLAQLYYEAGPKRIVAQIEELLRQLELEGHISIPDPELAARMFAALFKGSDILMRRQLDPETPVDPAAARAYCRYAVERFLTAHPPASAGT